MCVCVYICIYIYIHTYIHTYICMHTYKSIISLAPGESIGAQVLLPHDLPHAGLEAGSPPSPESHISRTIVYYSRICCGIL